MRLSRVTALVAWTAAALATPAPAQDFWAHWGDGRAELNGYTLTQPRYGAARDGTAVYVYVTEEFSDEERVKAEEASRPATYPVMKLNAVRDFQTGIYDYNVMTSTFLRVARGWPVAKVSFSSQEWCGHVWHQLVPRGDRVNGVLHSYFEGEADETRDLALPEGGVFEDALPIVLRGLRGDFLAAGESRDVPFLPSLLHSRFRHERLAWTTARISRAADAETVSVPAGRFDVSRWTVDVADGRRLVFFIEVAPPHRLVRQTGPDGEELALKGSTRLAYWKLNGPGGEKHLKELGLD